MRGSVSTAKGLGWGAYLATLLLVWPGAGEAHAHGLCPVPTRAHFLSPGVIGGAQLLPEERLAALVAGELSYMRMDGCGLAWGGFFQAGATFSRVDGAQPLVATGAQVAWLFFLLEAGPYWRGAGTTVGHSVGLQITPAVVFGWGGAGARVGVPFTTTGAERADRRAPVDVFLSVYLKLPILFRDGRWSLYRGRAR